MCERREHARTSDDKSLERSEPHVPARMRKEASTAACEQIPSG
jgi:hypothetical protein